MRRADIRFPYRAIGEIEDMIAHQLELLRLLEEARRHAATPAEWHRLNAQTTHAEAVFLWLRDQRAKMTNPEGDDPI